MLKIFRDIKYLEFSQGQKNSPTIIFFHGYGSNAQDLSSLHTFKLNIDSRWIFPNGLLPMDYGYSWFPLAMNINTNRREVHKHSITYLDKHCEQILQFIQFLNVKSDKIILGGFSQGAVMALNIALRMPNLPLALVIMSGSFFPQEILNSRKQSFLKKGSFFQCHGTKDEVLLHSESKKISSFLHSLKWDGEFVSFDGAHELPPFILTQIQSFINYKLS